MIRVGDKFTTNQGYVVEVVEYVGCNSVFVSFEEPVNIVVSVRASKLREGKINNPYHRSVYGVGFMGEGLCGKYRNHWHAMFKRCFSQKITAKPKFYEKVDIAEDWFNFSNFNRWSSLQKYEEGWHLDKDILGDGTLYSSDTCCYVPAEINQAIVLPRKSLVDSHRVGMYLDKRTGKYVARCRGYGDSGHIGVYLTEDEAFLAYKTVKEDRVRSLIVKWEDRIDSRVYDKLSKFTVEDWLG